jgi:AhpD family alkylhydroperoxidase
MPSREDGDWTFSYDELLHDLSPALFEAQRAWLASVDSLTALDRLTHELIRLVAVVIQRNHGGVVRHARLAAEVGASWEQIVTAIVLTEPAFGIAVAVEALPWARKGFDAAVAPIEPVDP